MFRLFWLSFILLFSQLSFAQDNRGNSFLGLCSPRFDCAQAIKTFNHASTIRVGWLDNTFADKCPCAEKILALPKPKVVRVHVANSTCFKERGRVCGSYEVFAGESIRSANEKVKKKDVHLLTKFRVRLARLKALLSKAVAPTRLLLSPCLECDLDDAARRVLIAETKAYFPTAEIVDCPLNNRCLPGFFCEKHGDPGRMKPPFIVDQDGLDFFGADAEAYGKRYGAAEVVFGWTRKYNCLNDPGSPFEDPRRRQHCPTAREFRVAGHWTRPASLTPSSPVSPRDKALCKKFYPARDGEKRQFLWKLGDGKTIAVALFPNTFKNRFKLVRVTKEGKDIDRGRFRAFRKEDNSNRQVWDFNRHVVDFPDNSVLNADGSCWVLDKPQFGRID